MDEDRKMKGLLPSLIKEIVESYEHTDKINHLEGVMLPDRDTVVEILNTLFEVIYPGYFGEKSLDKRTVEFHIGAEVERLTRILYEQIGNAIEHECKRLGRVCEMCREQAEEVTMAFISRIPVIREMLALDVEAAYDGDPAAKSFDEIIFSYPGMYAITVFRIAHELHRLGVPLIPRIMTEHAHSRTGIDIHPGANIGRSFFIDHGTGVVIGETCEIGNNVKIYQGVTLGALSFKKDEKGRLIRGTKRHPTIEDEVTIYAAATILGGETVIGKGSIIGGNVWVTHSVEPGTRVIFENPTQRIESGRPAKKKDTGKQ